MPIVHRHVCICGKPVDCHGLHGLFCRCSGCRLRQLAEVNEIIIRAIRAAHVQAELKLQQLLRENEKVPEGAALDTWHREKALVWDFTFPEIWPLIPVNPLYSRICSGQAKQNKRAKYCQLETS